MLETNATRRLTLALLWAAAAAWSHAGCGSNSEEIDLSAASKDGGDLSATVGDASSRDSGVDAGVSDATVLASSNLSTAPGNPFGAILTAPACTGPNCTAILNTCTGTDCHDISNSCDGASCQLTVYVNTQVAACLKDFDTAKSYGCFAPGISAVSLHPSASGTVLVLEAQQDSLFLASLFVSSAEVQGATTSTPPSLPSAMCAVTSAYTCSSSSCVLAQDVSITGSPCTLPFNLPLELNGYSLQGSSQLYFGNTITNSHLPQNPAAGIDVTNLTVAIASPSQTALDFSKDLGQLYTARFSGVTVYNGEYGINATNVQLGVYSCVFNGSSTGVKTVQTLSPGPANQRTFVYGSSFSDNAFGFVAKSTWARDSYVTVWQMDPNYQEIAGPLPCKDTKCYRDPTYASPVDTEPQSGIYVVGNLFAGTGQTAIDLESVNVAQVIANDIHGFSGVGIRAFKSKDPKINSNLIKTDDATHATIGVDTDYCEFAGIVHNDIRAKTGMVDHSYGGKYRHTQGMYYNNISAYVGVEGVWDQINSGVPLAPSVETWTAWMVDTEIAGNNFGGYSASYPSLYTPATSFANQPVANVPDLYNAGAMSSYPIYPFDRKIDPFTETSCAYSSKASSRNLHFVASIEGVICPSGNVVLETGWSGNYYADRMRNNPMASSDGGVSEFLAIPVWSLSAPTSECFDGTAASSYDLLFASHQSDYMVSANQIKYAGVCNLASPAQSYYQLLPSQTAFPPTSLASSKYGTVVAAIQAQAAMGYDNCSEFYPRAEFPVPGCD